MDCLLNDKLDEVMTNLEKINVLGFILRAFSDDFVNRDHTNIIGDMVSDYAKATSKIFDDNYASLLDVTSRTEGEQNVPQKRKNLQAVNG